MPNRIIKESICTSDTIEKLSWFDEVVFYRLIVNCDDYGRFDGRSAILKSRLFPLKSGVSERSVREAVRRLESAGLVLCYQVENRPYLQLKTWDKHQQVRAKRSKYPPYEGGALWASGAAVGAERQEKERCKQQEDGSDCHLSLSGPKEYSAQESEAFAAFWRAYPRKAARARAEAAFAKIAPDEELLARMLKAIDQQRRTQEWKKEQGRFIPYPATWLTQRRWEDETCERAEAGGEREYAEGEIESRLFDPIEEILKRQLAEQAGG